MKKRSELKEPKAMLQKLMMLAKRRHFPGVRGKYVINFFTGLLTLFTVFAVPVTDVTAASLSEPMTGATAPNWVIGGSAYLTASTGLDPVGDGWLRLTDLGLNQAGFGYLDTTFNITAGAVISYDYVTYGGGGDGGFGCNAMFPGFTGTGADGYSIYLFDGAQSFSVGGTGGSLGYANNTATGNPGLNYGYIGIGIDEWGNFSNPTEGRNGGPGGRCDAVTVRGPYNHPTGAYYWLGSTASGVSQLSFPGQGYRPLQTGPQYRKVVVYLTPQTPANGYLQIDVWLQNGYNQSMTQVITGLKTNRPVPATVKIGYAASTGGSNNYHEIRNLIIDPLPSSDIDLSMVKTVSSPTVTQGGAVTYTLTVRNSGPAGGPTATNIPISDSVPSDITAGTWTCTPTGAGASCGAASGAGNSISTTATLPVNTYVTYTIPGTVNAGTPLGTVISNTATLTVPGGITDYNVSNNSSTITTTVSGSVISIAGTVFNDNGITGGVAHDGIRNGSEAGTTNMATYFAKLYRSNDLTTVVASSAISAAGAYTINNVPGYGTYTIILSPNNTNTYNPSAPASWTWVSPANYTIASLSTSGANLTNQDFFIFNGSRFTGKVINDNGLNGAISNANDGKLNAAETGIAGVTVRLQNNGGGTTYDTDVTDAGGNFTLFTATSGAPPATGTTLWITETNPAGYSSVNFSAGNTGGTYTIASDYISFNYTQYTNYSNIIFGDVAPNTFTPTPQASSGSALTPVYYTHSFTPASGGSVTFAATGRTQGSWPAVSYYLNSQSNCGGSYSLISGALTAAAGVPLCIRITETIPATATNGTIDTITTTATFTYTNSVGPITATYTVADTTTVIASNLSTSTKTVVDVNGGDTNPGDVLRYTITITETAGNTATGISVTDNIPGNVDAINVASIINFPAGATNSSTYSGTGTNNTGYLNITGITVAANSSVTIVFDVIIAAGTPAGTVINNTATITNPAGPGGTPSALPVTVSASGVSGSGNKPLYLYDNTASPQWKMSRTPATAGTNSITLAAGASRVWTLDPALVSNVTLQSTVGFPATLYAARIAGGSGNCQLQATLSCSNGTTTGAGAYNAACNTTVSAKNITIPLNGTILCPSPNTWQLTVTNPAGATRTMIVYPLNGTNNSHVDLPSQNVITVNSVNYYDAPYPGGSLVTTVSPNSKLYIRSVVSDPFGSYDINSASVNIIDPNGNTVVAGGVMTQVADSGAATRTFEYLPATGYTIPLAPLGYWTARVTAVEGTEGLVTDFAQSAFLVAVPSLSAVKSVLTFSDPVNGTTTPKPIPGAVMQYTIQVFNSGAGVVDNNKTVITDIIPANSIMCVTSTCSNPLANPVTLPFCSSAPAPACGLTLTYGTDVTYANKIPPLVPADFTYTPTPDPDGYDMNVTAVSINPKGIFNAASGGNNAAFSVTFKVKVK